MRKFYDLFKGLFLIAAFAVWTLLVQTVDVQPAGETGTPIGFSALNIWFHRLTGVHMSIYTITDWLGLVPVCICLLFVLIGFVQMVKRRNPMKVDADILLLGIYYFLIISAYLVFEMLPVNFRPILIDGRTEASYPSSTTLLVLSIMPTLPFQAERRLKNVPMKRAVCILSRLFSLFMVVGRMISGVHWFTDIVGSVLLSTGLFRLYQAAVQLHSECAS